ncbi:MAG: hypothetical protein ACR2PQ_07440 [Myxococcota bacterium]
MVAVILAWVALWPLVHRGLVARYDLNPWKLGAFAMYTTPTPPVLAVLLVPADGGLVPLDESALPGSVRREGDAFRARRHALGEWARPDAWAEEVLSARPDLRGVVVMVQRMILDRQTARMSSRSARHAYSPGALPE